MAHSRGLTIPFARTHAQEFLRGDTGISTSHYQPNIRFVPRAGIYRTLRVRWGLAHYYSPVRSLPPLLLHLLERDRRSVAFAFRPLSALKMALLVQMLSSLLGVLSSGSTSRNRITEGEELTGS
jgi:hypothetical protein